MIELIINVTNPASMMANITPRHWVKATIRWWNNTLNFINNQTPATTSVDEWTSDLTGVGALIAKGSQEDNGNWALLVIAPIATIHIMITLIALALETNPNPTWHRTSAMNIKRQISPTRLDITQEQEKNNTSNTKCYVNHQNTRRIKI